MFSYLLLLLLLLHPRLELVLVLLAPAAQRRPAEQRVVRVPLHAPLVHGLGDVVVGAQNPELARGHLRL